MLCRHPLYNMLTVLKVYWIYIANSLFLEKRHLRLVRLLYRKATFVIFYLRL